jgi:hypothetical protein
VRAFRCGGRTTFPSEPTLPFKTNVDSKHCTHPRTSQGSRIVPISIVDRNTHRLLSSWSWERLSLVSVVPILRNEVAFLIKVYAQHSIRGADIPTDDLCTDQHDGLKMVAKKNVGNISFDPSTRTYIKLGIGGDNHQLIINFKPPLTLR